MKVNKEKYTNQRLMAIDYGEKRVGLALSDIMHIISSPKDYLERQEKDFWDKLGNFIESNQVGLIVIGIPTGSTNTKILDKIEAFKKKLTSITDKDIFTYDENFTSKRASEVMINSGMKKTDRQKKENTDMIAASLILRDFMEEYF